MKSYDGQFHALLKRQSTNVDIPWQSRHFDAITKPHAGCELSIVSMLKGWLQCADFSEVEYESPIGHDYVLGPEWLSIGKGIHGLLNGQTGRLDCGTLSSVINDAIKLAGYENGLDSF